MESSCVAVKTHSRNTAPVARSTVRAADRPSSGRAGGGEGRRVAGRGEAPEFIEALARGLDVIRAFGADRPRLTLAEVATASDLARPTARRLLLTLTELGSAAPARNV